MKNNYGTKTSGLIKTFFLILFIFIINFNLFAQPLPNPSIRFVGTNNELFLALKDVSGGLHIGVIEAYQNFIVYDSMPLPSIGVKLELDGNNQQLTVATPHGNLFYRTIENADDANEKIDLALNIHDWIFFDNNINLKKSPSGDCIHIKASYKSSIHNNYFSGFINAVHTDFSLGTNIENNRFWETAGTCILIDWRGINNGNPSTTQSNVTRIADNVMRPAAGSFAAIAVYGSSGVLINNNTIKDSSSFISIIDHNIIEGGNASHIGSQYGIFFDDNNSPNVKSVTVSNNHFEVIFPKARCYIKLQTGNAFLIHNYFQYPGIDLETKSEGYAVFHLDTPDYIPASTTYKDGGGTFEFTGYEYPFDPFSAKSWAGGKVPSSVSLLRYGNGADKMLYIKTHPGMIINGKQY